MTEPGTQRKGTLSFVRRNGRISDAQERAWRELAPAYVVDVPRDVAETSVHPDARLVPADEFGRTAPLVIEVGTGQGHAILHASDARG
jgi:tRNA (guanine-N7-)-methyltransferase